ncbi:MAG: SulP family inorganic anion transporter, partial [Leucobacter sp.]
MSIEHTTRSRIVAYWGALFPQRSDYAGLKRTWRGDLAAGVTVGIVALPLALGFGISSGVGAEAGLITAIVAGIIAAVFGGSNVQVSGPTGAMVVVLAPIVATQGLGAVAAVTLLAGIIVVAAAALKLGRAVTVIPWPVIEGFTLGIAVIIFMQQVPALTGPDAGGASASNVVVTAVTSLASADTAYLLWSLLIVAVVAACMLLLPRLHAAIPGSLIGVAIATGISFLLPLTLASIGVLPSTLPAPTLPEVDLGAITQLAPAAFAVAALAAIESLLSARVAASMANTGPFDPDRELMGQGLASVGASLFGGMPATGAIARTAVNVRAGARTRLAAIFHGVVLLLVVLLFAAPVS